MTSFTEAEARIRRLTREALEWALTTSKGYPMPYCKEVPSHLRATLEAARQRIVKS